MNTPWQRGQGSRPDEGDAPFGGDEDAIAVRRTGHRGPTESRRPQSIAHLTVDTNGQGLTEVTPRIAAFLDELAAGDGLLTIFCRHTSASLLIQENADRDVRHDLEVFFSQIAPESRTLYRHNAEGADDMPAHIRTALTQVQLSIPVEAGRMVLGTWQGIYVFEHRRQRHRRELVLHFLRSD